MTTDASRFSSPPAAPPSPASLPLRRGFNPLARHVEERDGFPVLPGAFPIFGHMPAQALDALGLLREAERRMGPFFFWNLGFGAWHLVSMQRDSITLFRNKVTDSGYIRAGRALADLFGHGLIAHDGAFHQHL